MPPIPSESRRTGRRLQRRAVAVLAATVAGLLALVAATGAPAGSSPVEIGRQRGGTVSADGLSATDGQRTLRVAQAQGLAEGGQTVAVAGSGYDVSKGIYVALCLVTPPDQPPTPCGGGIDIDGVSGASAWISSNPPSYGEGLAQPYGEGGSFSVTVNVGPALAGGIDCRQVQCAIVTRNDHVRTADRGQDIIIPVTFSSGPVATPPPTTAGPTTTLAPPPPPTTTAPPPAPPITLSDDGLTATDGSRRLTVSAAADLDPTGETLTVSASGFEDTKGVLVTLCRAAATPTEAPAPCLAGSTPDASAWVSSSPPEHAVDLVVPFGDDGSFEVDVEVAAVIDDETDCREVDCAVVVRRDDADPADRTLDMAIPVAFLDEAPVDETPPTTEAAVVADVETDDGGGTSPLVWVGLGVLAAVVVGIAVAVRRKGATPSSDGPPSEADPSEGPSADGPIPETP